MVVKRTVATVAVVVAAAVGGCSAGVEAEPAGPQSTPATATSPPRPEVVPSSNVIPVGPPEVRAKALGVSEEQIATIQADVERWWDDQGFSGQKGVCRSLQINGRFMGEWMADTGLPAGPQQELAAQTLLQLTDSFCWRLQESFD